jgi:hypothetical protein
MQSNKMLMSGAAGDENVVDVYAASELANSQTESSQVPFGWGTFVRCFSEKNVIAMVQFSGVMVWRIPVIWMWSPALGRVFLGWQMMVPDWSSIVKWGKGWL